MLERLFFFLFFVFLAILPFLAAHFPCFSYQQPPSPSPPCCGCIAHIRKTEGTLWRVSRAFATPSQKDSLLCTVYLFNAWSVLFKKKKYTEHKPLFNIYMYIKYIYCAVLRSWGCLIFSFLLPSHPFPLPASSPETRKSLQIWALNL